MKIPRHWAKGEATAQLKNGKSATITCWRGSISSQQEAEAIAQKAARDRVEKILSGNEKKSDYLDQPPREEVVEEIFSFGREPDGIVTRNVYGALVLNTSGLVFLDIDKSRTSFNSLKGIFTRLFGKGKNKNDWESTACATIETEIKKRPYWGGRVYRTRNGLRVMLTHATFEELTPELSTFMIACNTDPLYMKLCEKQKCYRARLTPKPTRIKMKRPSVRFPYLNEADVDAFAAWKTKYEQASTNFSTCEYITSFGSTTLASGLAKLVEYHDEMAKVDDRLPLA